MLRTIETTPQGRDYFGRGHPLTRIQVRLSLRSRRKMFDLWKRFAGPLSGKRVLDFGSTPDTERGDSNCMVPWFVAEGVELSLYSPEDISGLGQIFSEVKILPSGTNSDSVPCEDRSFDWVCSSAVLEHVGNSERQIGHLQECGRIANGIFLTAPNRGHWLEFHTKIPMLHWLPKPLHRNLLSWMGMKTWSQESHLNLVGAQELLKMARVALPDFDLELETVRALGMASNLILLGKRREPGLTR